MALTPLNDTQQKAAMVIGKSYWLAVFKQQFPNATKEQRKDSWKENRKEYLKLGRVAVRSLIHSKFSVTGGEVK